ncbi:RagB/SusD family nutrient uptake outer membrane protein [Mucilaginibacter auburnensis]|uniref:Putative outer membrane starch-binding protein n=1 Tax=Mucilaginibacter auburnensis TaxID=1457233 RepID=A0A2H9VN60_9SPHI|nr:RagB/SusD family nutrient uptake outer membrane protein [Mucilaginibacter auburnensis]PJJ79764.1 putative outer membrane starch-binding protein [Mucilaginibacter auburnensis]
MKKKFLYSLFALFLINTVFIGCKRDLTVVPNSVVSDASVYTDKNLITSVLARFYSQINGGNAGAGWGASNATDDSYQQDPDDAQNNRGGASAQQVLFTKNRYRAFDYGLIRRINIFLQGIRSEESKKSMSAFDNSSFEGQALFLRAWTFFHMVKTLGGMTIVGDQVFEFNGGTDATPLQLKRNSEEECYDYILAQCDLAAAKLTSSGIATIPATQNKNAALANRWAAKMLKARAALTAASIAKFNTPGDALLEKKDRFGTQTHGIPASKADAYYKAAFDAAKEVIDGGAYQLMTGGDLASAQQAFNKVFNVKDGNTEVIWAADRQSPNINTQWTSWVGPVTHTEGPTGNQLGAPADFVDTFEDRLTGAQGIRTRTLPTSLLNEMIAGSTNPPIMYDLSNPADNPFMQKDARLWGSVIWPQAVWKGTPVDLRAGEWRGEYNADGTLKVYTSAPPAKGTQGTFLTSINGPAENTSNIVNKTGFIPRKWLDEKPGASLSPNYSDIWMIRFRLAEAYAICAESALLSGPLGGPGVGVTYINFLRRRGLLPDLTAGQFTFDQLRRELRIEFFMEDHRLWDMNRWRLADQYWDGPTDSKRVEYPNGTSYPYQLYGYTVNLGAGNPNNGKYVFERKKAFRKRANPQFFQRSSYYSSTDDSWRTWNPNWERNPGE